MTNDDWTPVTKGLPEKYRQVLVQYYDGEFDVAIFTQACVWTRRGIVVGGVVAWRPIPPPWRGEGA